MKRSQNVPAKVRAQVRERSGGNCEARIKGACRGRAVQIHHRLPRSQGGRHDLANLLDLCGPGGCHDHIHQHPAWAYEHGFLIRRAA